MLGVILHFIKIMPISDGMYYSIAPLAILGITAGAQALLGAGQFFGAGKKPKMPEFKFSESETEALNLARQRAREGLPQSSVELAEMGIAQAALMQQRNLQNLGRGAVLAGSGNIQAIASRSALDLASRDAAERIRGQEREISALLSRAQSEYSKQQYEMGIKAGELQKYESLRGAGIQNVANAINTFTGGFLQNQYTQALLGTGGSTTRTTLRTNMYNPQQQFLSGTIKPIQFTPKPPRI